MVAVVAAVGAVAVVAAAAAEAVGPAVAEALAMAVQAVADPGAIFHLQDLPAVVGGTCKPGGDGDLLGGGRARSIPTETISFSPPLIQRTATMPQATC